jgi:hypothetical protein
MKIMHLLAALVSIGLLAFSNPPNRTKSIIIDDEQNLSIKIEVLDTNLWFDESFDIRDKNFLQKDLILMEAFESVGASVPVHELHGYIFSWFFLKFINLLF